jgi:hypothetical protein
MKILFYTINDGNQEYLKCLDISYSTLQNYVGSIDFKIYTDNNGYNKILENSTSTIVEKTTALEKIARWKYIGDLKFHPYIFDQDYEYFVYLDNDVLWKNINNEYIFNALQNFSGFKVNEGKIHESDKFHSYSWDSQQIEQYKNHWGVNAGLFCVSKSLGINLSDFFTKEVVKYSCDYSDTMKQAMIEQSLFNRFIITQKYYSSLLDISSNVKNIYSIQELDNIKNNYQDKIYHFMSFNQGGLKYEFMNQIKSCN